MTSAAYPWWRVASDLMQEVERYHLLSEADSNAIDSGGWYAEYFSNCAAENRRHAERYTRKLQRLLRRSGIEIGVSDMAEDKMDRDIVARLREIDCDTARDAADMLEFFLGQMQMHDPAINGRHRYRFRSSGWPMTHCVGPTAEDAVRAAVDEIKRSRSESA